MSDPGSFLRPSRRARTPSGRWLALLILAGVGAYVLSLGHGSGARSDWPDDLVGALATASRTGRPVLIQFSSPGCLYCTEMERRVLNEGPVRKALESFELAHVDAWADADTSRRYAVDAIPAFIVLTPDGRQAGRVEGFVPVDQFLEFLQQSQSAARTAASTPPRS